MAAYPAQDFWNFAIMDVDLPISHSPSVTSPAPSSSTPRRTHLKQLSLAPGSSPLRSTPPSPASTSPFPRSSTDGSFTLPSASSQPTSPSPLTRAGSLGRNPRRQSSISYAPSPSYRTQSFALGQSSGGPPPLAGSPLGLGLGNVGGRPLLEGRRSVSEVVNGGGERSSAGVDDVPRAGPSLSNTPARSRNGSASSVPAEREPAEMTLVEKHADLLSYIAQKESRSLELKEALALNEKELDHLKRKWTSIVSRGAGRPSPNQANAVLPVTGSMPASASSALLGSSADGGGLLGPETLQSGKRFLSSLLGVGEETEGASAEWSSSQGGPQPLKESNGSSANTPRSAPSRSSLDILASVARSGLEMVTESLEDPSNSPPKHTSTGNRPLSMSSSPMNRTISGSSSIPSSARSKRLSMMSSTSSSSSTAPSSLDFSSSSHGGSIDSTSSSSSLFSLTPTDERPAFVVGSDTDRLAGIGEESASSSPVEEKKRDPRSLVDDMASSTGSAGLAGWGRRWGDLATAMTGNESFQSSKRATLSLASTFQSTLNTLASPPPHATSHPLSSPGEGGAGLFPVSPTPKMRQATKMKTLDAPWDALGGAGGLQEPLVPVGRSPSPRIGPVSPGRKKVEEVKKETPAVVEDDGWNW